MIPAAIAQIFNPIAELLIPIGIPSKEAKAEIEIHLVIVEAKISFRVVQPLLCFFAHQLRKNSTQKLHFSSIFFNLKCRLMFSSSIFLK